MAVTTFEAIVKNGQIVPLEESKLPEAARVYVVVPDLDRPRRVTSPRLVNKADFEYFRKTVEEDFED